MIIIAGPVYAQEYPYKITGADTPTTINASNTTAAVDTVNHVISLPKHDITKAVGFWDTGLDYFALTATEFKHFSFDGTNMQENNVASIPGLNGPIAAAASSPYPDAVIASGNTITHYSFNGTSMGENAALTLQGLEPIVSISTKGVDTAVLNSDGLNYYGSTGTGMARIPSLSLTSSQVTSPIDVALCPDTYNYVILERDQVKYFNFTGNNMVENPTYSIQGLNNPLTVAVNDESGLKVSVVENNQVNTYIFDGSGMVLTSALSVVNGLTKPTSIALKPGSQDILIVDGNDIKYYSYDGTKLVYNPYLSQTVAGLSDLIGYAKSAVVQSNTIAAPGTVQTLKVRAYQSLPENTTVTWAVSADGGLNWTTCWRARGLLGNTVAEVTQDNGNTWTAIGNASVCNPTSSDSRLWANVSPGNALMWRGTLGTTDNTVTPQIVAPNPGIDSAVVLTSNTNPSPPVIDVPGICYLTATPLFSWSFNDADSGDTQSAFQVVIKSAVDGTALYDTSKLEVGTTKFQFPASTDPATPGPLWASGTNQYLIEARVWDSAGAVSNWSSQSFCILALERPRIMEIVEAPAGEILPTPAVPATHILINKGYTIANLPTAKAGSKVTVLIDAISTGTSMNAVFPYASSTATLEAAPSCITVNGTNRRYMVSFWTSANLAVCPDNTIVEAQFTDNSGAELLMPTYADGIIRISGSMYTDWIVTLQGSNQ